MAAENNAAASIPEDGLSERRTLRDYYIILRERMWIALPLAIICDMWT